MKFEFYQQLDRMDCGPCCLQMILKFYTGNKYKITYLRYLCDVGKDGCSLYSIKEAAKLFGIDGTGYSLDINEIIDLKPYPCILHWGDNHFVILYRVAKSFTGEFRFYIADPFRGKYILSLTEFQHRLSSNKNSGYVLYFDNMDAELINNNDFIEKKTSNFIFKTIRNNQTSYLLIVFGIILTIILQVIFPFLSKSMFDFGIQDKNFPFVVFIIFSFGGFYLLRILIQYLRDYTLLNTGVKISIEFVTTFLRKIIMLKYEYFDMKNSGDIIQSITDNSRIENLLTNNLTSFILSLSNLIVFEFILLYFDWKLFVILNVSMVIYLSMSLIIQQKFKNIDYLRFEILSKNQSFIYQLINGILDLKMNNGLYRKIVEWKNLRQDLYDISHKSIKLQQIKKLLGLLLMNCTTLSIIGYSAYQVILDNMTIGEFLAIQYIMAQLSLPIDDILDFKLSYDLAKISFKRFEDANDFPNEKIIQNDERFLLNNDIIFRNVNFSFPGNKQKEILKNVNITIKAGKINAIVGPSGSGKTTFIKLLLKLYDPTSGEILVGNDGLSEVGHDVWRKLAGCVLQDGYLFSESILNNIVLEGGEVNQHNFNCAVSVANLDEFVSSLPNKYNTVIGQDGVGLSGGQRQRILIARCIYKSPQLIILDEATNALDSINEDLIYKNLSKYYEDKTIVIIAHRLSTIKNADQIIVFNDGFVQESGSHKQLILNKGVYYNLCEKQEL